MKAIREWVLDALDGEFSAFVPVLAFAVAFGVLDVVVYALVSIGL